MKLISSLLEEESGQGLVEYSLIIFLVIIAAVGAVRTFGIDLASYYQTNIVDKLP